MTVHTPILFEDDYLIICNKPRGLVSEDQGLPSAVMAEYGYSDLYCVNRLDKEVSGVIVLARGKEMAAKLTALFSTGQAEKKYLAITDAALTDSKGTMEDLLFHDKRTNKTYVVTKERKGVKKASLSYDQLGIDSKSGHALYLIQLHSGRSHQIRVQFGSRKYPLVGDGRYGSKVRNCPIALFSYSLAFKHPITQNMIDISAEPEGEIWETFKDVIKTYDLKN